MVLPSFSTYTLCTPSLPPNPYPNSLLLQVPAKDTDIAAIVHANRSMCHMSKKDGVKALDDADRGMCARI